MIYAACLELYLVGEFSSCYPFTFIFPYSASTSLQRTAPGCTAYNLTSQYSIEPATPIDNTGTSRATNSTHTVDTRPFDVIPNKSSENEIFEQNSDEDV